LHGIHAIAILTQAARPRLELAVIRSFGDQRTTDIYHGHATREVKRLDAALVKVTVRKLDMIAAACAVLDLRSPPGNRLEALHGDLDGWFSIRANDQWRLIFRWVEGQAEDVKLVDYH
jgi:proteic killer suppression protein